MTRCSSRSRWKGTCDAPQTMMSAGLPASNARISSSSRSWEISTIGSAGEPWTMTILASVDQRNASLLGQLLEELERQLADGLARLAEAFGHEALGFVGRLERLGAHLDQGVVADAAHALGADLREPLEDLHRLRAAEQEIAGHVDVLHALPLELGQHGVERAEVAVDVGEERHRRRYGPSGHRAPSRVAAPATGGPSGTRRRQLATSCGRGSSRPAMLGPRSCDPPSGGHRVRSCAEM